MKKIEVNTLRPGLKFSEPVYIEGDNILVPAGVPIREKDISRLDAWGIDTVETDGEILPSDSVEKAAGAEAGVSAGQTLKTITAKSEKTPARKDASVPVAAAEIPKKTTPSMLSLTEVQENKGAYRNYVALIERLDEIFDSFANGIAVEVRSIDNIARRYCRRYVTSGTVLSALFSAVRSAGMTWRKARLMSLFFRRLLPMNSNCSTIKFCR